MVLLDEVLRKCHTFAYNGINFLGIRRLTNNDHRILPRPERKSEINQQRLVGIREMEVCSIEQPAKPCQLLGIIQCNNGNNYVGLCSTTPDMSKYAVDRCFRMSYRLLWISLYCSQDMNMLK